jgi:hypothetical protein
MNGKASPNLWLKWERYSGNAFPVRISGEVNPPSRGEKTGSANLYDEWH